MQRESKEEKVKKIQIAKTECLKHTIDFLEFNEKVNLLTVSRQFRQECINSMRDSVDFDLFAFGNVQKSEQNIIKVIDLIKPWHITLSNLKEGKALVEAVNYLSKVGKLRSLSIFSNPTAISQIQQQDLQEFSEKVSFLLGKCNLETFAIEFTNLNNFLKLSNGFLENDNLKSLKVITNSNFGENETNFLILTLKHLKTLLRLESLSLSKTFNSVGFLNLAITELKTFSSLRSLDISRHAFVSNDTLAILGECANNVKGLREIDLSFCNLTNNHLEPLKAIFLNFRELKSLFLQGNTGIGLNVLKVLTEVNKLENLNISNCGITYGGLIVVIEIIQSNKEITTLDLSMNNLQFVDTFKIASLKTSDSLKNISEEVINSNLINRLLLEISLSQIKSLSLNSCGIAEGAIHTMTDYFNFGQLKLSKLDISNNNTFYYNIFLGKSLTNSLSKLHKLNLSKTMTLNSKSMTNAFNWFNSLVINSKELEEVNLSSNFIPYNKDNSATLQLFLNELPNLKYFDISSNNLGLDFIFDLFAIRLKAFTFEKRFKQVNAIINYFSNLGSVDAQRKQENEDTLRVLRVKFRTTFKTNLV